MVAETIPDPRPRMRTYLLKLLKTGLPTAAGLGVVGYAFARFAGMWYVSEAGGRTAIGASDIAEALEWRLPLTMAAWGFGLVALFEGILSIWRKPTAPLTAVTPVDETEQLLLKLLEEAEAAEDERQRMFALGQTPLGKRADADVSLRRPQDSRSREQLSSFSDFIPTVENEARAAKISPVEAENHS